MAHSLTLDRPSVAPDRWGFHLQALALPAMHLVAAGLGGPWLLLPAGFIFGVIPLIDALAGPLRESRSFEAADAHDKPLTGLAVAGILVWFAVLGVTLFQLSRTPAGSLTWWALAFNGGVAAGVQGVVIGHELGHRRTPGLRMLGAAAIISAWMPQFMVSHNESHHRFAATPRDPSTSREGETFWAYLVRSWTGGFRDAIAIDNDRVAGMSPFRRLLHHRTARNSAILVGAALVLAGWNPALPGAWFCMGLVANLLFESVNYLGHYGLQRREIDGVIEPFSLPHAWNSDHWSSRAMLYELGRHPDHHSHARLPWTSLRSSERSPQLPWGYPAMIMLSLVPPLWFRVMNPRLHAHRQRAAGG
jgi:alkane 1-monooxygenase